MKLIGQIASEMFKKLAISPRDKSRFKAQNEVAVPSTWSE